MLSQVMGDGAGHDRPPSGCGRSLLFIRKSQKPEEDFRWGKGRLRSVCFGNHSHSGKEAGLAGCNWTPVPCAGLSEQGQAEETGLLIARYHDALRHMLLGLG